jgi:hypothetical protein
MKRQRSAAKKLRNEYFGRARGGLTLRFVKVGMALPWDGETPLDGEGMASYLRLCVAAGLLQYLVSPEDED